VVGGAVFIDAAAAAGPGIGGGIGAWAAFRFIRWGVEFIFSRTDIRATRMDVREKALELRFNERLRHVERELELYRDALMFLVNHVAERDPANPALQHVSRMLRGAWPVHNPVTNKSGDDCSDVIDKLNKVPGVKKP
jgi:hypothetical protein